MLGCLSQQLELLHIRCGGCAQTPIPRFLQRDFARQRLFGHTLMFLHQSFDLRWELFGADVLFSGLLPGKRPRSDATSDYPSVGFSWSSTSHRQQANPRLNCANLSQPKPARRNATTTILDAGFLPLGTLGFKLRASSPIQLGRGPGRFGNGKRCLVLVDTCCPLAVAEAVVLR